MASLVILSAGSAAQSCVILPYCVISIVALFMHLSVMFAAGRQKLGLFRLEYRTVLQCNRQQGHQEKEEFELRELAGAEAVGLVTSGNTLSQIVLQGLFHLEL